MSDAIAMSDVEVTINNRSGERITVEQRQGAKNQIIVSVGQPAAAIADLEKAIKDADGADRWNGFGEGYASLRAAVEKAIVDLRTVR